MKRTLFVLPVLFVLSSLHAHAQKSSVIYIRIQESVVGGGFAFGSIMTIAHPDDRIENIELSKRKASGEGEGAEKNAIAIRKKLNELLNQGYVLQSSSIGGDHAVYNTVMILVRKE